ncbi:hypothetical protein [Sphingobacterium pedocola]|uniref:Uncharacterized protein n=1 Tax=Sphingobacterium pedocola TaxID=2082722 RepID=A0ABR9T5Q4_9SPHI|nr:hypothetical protein [Sphingobacterium pedocola]MBE8720678.1 hypothetical protein [Sphingobacterium pedocola]
MKSKFLKLAGLAAAALFCTIEANAQVGIGTPTPADAAQLEIFADNKGILIPRVELASTTDGVAVEGTEIESLLVYNTGTSDPAAVADEKERVYPGFYYWVPATVTAPVVAAHWERIVNQAQLDEVINNLNADTEKIKALLNVAFPSNNLGDPAVDDGVLGNGKESGGGLVYTPGTPASGSDPAIPASFKFVYFDAATSTYITEPVNINELKIILGDVITSGGDSVFTGDTYVVGGITHYIYRGEFETTITANSAVTTGVTLDKVVAADGILSASLRYNGGMTASLTDLTVASDNLVVGFNVGVGKMYSVLGTSDISAKVIVEFASSVAPDGL